MSGRVLGRSCIDSGFCQCIGLWPNPKRSIALLDFQLLAHVPGFTQDSQRVRGSASSAYKRTSAPGEECHIHGQ